MTRRQHYKQERAGLQTLLALVSLVVVGVSSAEPE